MVEAGFVTRAQADAAERRGFAAVPNSRPGARYFADWVAEQIRELAGTGKRDLTVRTTLDPRLQAMAENAIADILARYGGEYRVGPGRAGRDGAGRRGTGDGRRPRLRQQPVQPRDPGAAPAGLGVQAVRLSRRARGRHAPAGPRSSTRRSASATGSRTIIPAATRAR